MQNEELPYAVKRSETGLGLFATRAIAKGERLIEYIGLLVANEDLQASNGKYFFGIDDEWSIDGSSRRNVARYINHSCRPTADAKLSGRRIWLWARKKLKAGEKITFNYGPEYFDQVIKPKGCRCEKCH
ncbi:MAG: SET domain-containing protein [Pyrinomonadaceae bacterium]